jgi:benzoyl-CoA reductase subunit D
MITAGIDCGARNTKTVILKDGRIIGRGSAPTGFDLQKAVDASLVQALHAADLTREDLERIVGTGSGKSAVMFADDTVNEIRAMAKAANFFHATARTVADVGAEEGRAAKIDPNGEPVDFAVNEKCAAGAGTFIEAMARALAVSVEEMGSMCLQSDKKIPMNARCAIFAESEVVGLIHARAAKPDISKAIHDAVAGRIVSMIRRIGVNEDLVLIGGLGRNPGFVASLKRELGVEVIRIPDRPEFGAATGAAVVAAQAVE